MASNSFRLFSLPLFSVLILFSSAHGADSSGEKVIVYVYYESFSAESSRFLTNELLRTFYDGLIKVIDLHLVPYGNAQQVSNGSFVCEHGTEECLLNSVEACASYLWPQQYKYYTSLYCLQSMVNEGNTTNWKNCFAKELGFEPKLIEDCYQGLTGKHIFILNAAKTEALDPPHFFLPWVLVDDLPIYRDFQVYEKFASHICKAYGGLHLPQACSRSR